MKIYFTLITTICSLLPFCCGRLFSTFYLSYSSRQMVDSRIYVSKRNLLKDVMRSDDSPYQLVQLPFPFIYFGQSLNMLFVSPNGGKVTHLLYITSTRVFINDLTHIQHCILLRISLALLMRSVVNSKETSEVLFVDY